jgi:tRNA (Thr-GGU) A37 N-methylase
VIQLKPLGICPAPLREVRGNLLRVRGLYVLDGTPVLDLKSYLERGDTIVGTHVGAWVR